MVIFRTLESLAHSRPMILPSSSIWVRTAGRAAADLTLPTVSFTKLLQPSDIRYPFRRSGPSPGIAPSSAPSGSSGRSDRFRTTRHRRAHQERSYSSGHGPCFRQQRLLGQASNESNTTRVTDHQRLLGYIFFLPLLSWLVSAVLPLPCYLIRERPDKPQSLHSLFLSIFSWLDALFEKTDCPMSARLRDGDNREGPGVGPIRGLARELSHDLVLLLDGRARELLSKSGGSNRLDETGDVDRETSGVRLRPVPG